MGIVIEFDDKAKKKWLKKKGYIRVDLLQNGDVQYLYRWNYDDYTAQTFISALEVESVPFDYLVANHERFINNCMKDIRNL